jgi:hypothetical protein
VIASCFSLTACGGSDDGWKTINPPGTQCTFELPEPVNNPPREGYKMYETEFEKNKKIQVGIFPRPAADPAKGDAELLNEFEQSSIAQIQDNLTKSGFDPQLQFDGDLAVEGGLGQQIKILAGDQFVTTLFYLTPRGLYFVKIDNADQTDPTIDRFMKSFEP